MLKKKPMEKIAAKFESQNLICKIINVRHMARRKDFLFKCETHGQKERLLV